MSNTPEHPTVLDPDDAGEAGLHFMKDAAKQDDAFCAAMRAAMKAGKERIREGVRVTAADDCRHVPRPFVPSHVPTASSLDFV